MNNKKVDVSIIIRSLNEEKLIDDLFQGIDHQRTNFTYEVILVDSGSTDKTLDIAKKYDTKIVHIEPERFTFGFSLNCGIEAAQGDICVIISAHCCPINENWLSNMYQPFANERVGLVYGKQVGNNDTKFSEHQIFRKWFPEKSESHRDLPFCNNANSAIRKSLWYNKKFDESLTGLEDLDWAKHILNSNRIIYYNAEASVAHIHEETYSQVYRRYYREALAFKQVFPHEYFGLSNFVGFLTINIINDFQCAFKQGKFISSFFSILAFRFMQFWGTYRAHAFKKNISKDMRIRLFYPPEFDITKHKKVNTPTPSKIFDITKPLHPEIAVWPGSPPFVQKTEKTFQQHSVNESSISMNSHTGTHCDAPYHFINDGKKLKDLPIERFIGQTLVLNKKDNETIEESLYRARKPKNRVKKLIIKTAIEHNDVEFNRNFPAITPNDANFLVREGIELVGIDNPSIQKFNSEDNETHKILLKDNIIILEGLNLSHVDEGIYDLYALPLKIPDAEAAPVRAILIKH